MPTPNAYSQAASSLGYGRPVREPTGGKPDDFWKTWDRLQKQWGAVGVKLSTVYETKLPEPGAYAPLGYYDPAQDEIKIFTERIRARQHSAFHGMEPEEAINDVVQHELAHYLQGRREGIDTFRNPADVHGPIHQGFQRMIGGRKPESYRKRPPMPPSQFEDWEAAPPGSRRGKWGATS